MPENKYISIIIPTTQDREVIFSRTLINAIDAVRNIDAEILVINDTKGYKPPIPQEGGNVSVFNSPGRGVAAARNYGASLASADLLLFLDNDIIISANSINHILNSHNIMPDACINPDWVYPEDLEKKLGESNFGRFLKEHNMTTQKGWFGDNGWKDNELFLAPAIASFHLSISKSNFLKTGGYDTSFPYAGAEDYDFCQRLKSTGMQLYIDSRIVVLHNEADKLDIDFRFKSQQLRAMTRRIAANLGHGTQILNYNLKKKIILSNIYLFKPQFLKIMKLLPCKNWAYRVYCMLYIVVEASVIYKGYTSVRD